jgi:SM-20-related protein
MEERLLVLARSAWADAGTGRHGGYQAGGTSRRDKTVWLSGDDPVESSYLKVMEGLRRGLNRRLFLGLFDYESHFALYPVGGYYDKHVDALEGRSNRTLSAVLYLNRDWHSGHGGELILYPPVGSEPLRAVLPEMGTLVLFLSKQFPHEVKSARRERLSLTGWFRENPSDSSRIDPAR